MDNIATLTRTSPWHQGERALQRSVGVAEQMEELGGRVIRDHLLEQHRKFFPLLDFVVIGTVDAAGDAWATLRSGDPGFLDAPDPYRLDVHLSPDSSDPAQGGMHDNQSIALLGIDLRTRRRNRLNGVVEHMDTRGFSVSVSQSYGNCPQYIQRRNMTRKPGAEPTPSHWLEHLDTRALAMIAEANTFFVASYVDKPGEQRQVDVSHRGGPAGFVRVSPEGVLTVPDYSGNRFFNTLGNLLVNPKSGLVFVDFEHGDLLQLTGDAEVILDSPEIDDFPGAERLWRFTPRRMVYRPNALPLRWTAVMQDRPLN